MCLNSQWLQMSLRSLCLLSVRSLMLRILPWDVAIYCVLDLVDPYGRHYGLPFRSRHCILDIIPLDQLELFDHFPLPFLLGYFFIAGRIYINDVAQQCHTT